MEHYVADIKCNEDVAGRLMRVEYDTLCKGGGPKIGLEEFSLNLVPYAIIDDYRKAKEISRLCGATILNEVALQKGGVMMFYYGNKENQMLSRIMSEVMGISSIDICVDIMQYDE